MKKVLGVLIVFAILVVGIGFQRAWFTLSSPGSDTGSNQVNVNLATDTDKIREDAAIVKDKAAQLTGSAPEQPATPGEASAEEGQPNGITPDLSPLKAGETSAARGRNRE